MSTTERVIQFFIDRRDDYFRIQDIVDYTGLRYMQVAAVIHNWRRFGKVEVVKYVYGSRRKYVLYRLKTAGKKYINKKASKLIYVV